MKRAWLYCRGDAPEDRNGVLKKQEKQLYDFAEQLGYSNNFNWLFFFLFSAFTYGIVLNLMSTGFPL